MVFATSCLLSWISSIQHTEASIGFIITANDNIEILKAFYIPSK